MRASKALAACSLLLLPILAIAPGLAQTPAPAQARPIIDYVGNADFRSARLSPDGKNIALIAPKDNKESMYILDAVSGQIKAAFDTQVNNRVSRFWWANDERIVFETVVNFGGGDQLYATGDVFAFNVDNTKKFILAGPSAGDEAAYMVLDALDDDRDHILVMRKDIKKNSVARSHALAMKIDIYREPKTGGHITISNIKGEVNSPFPWGDLFADNKGVVRLATSTNEAGELQVQLRQGDKWEALDNFFETSQELSNLNGQPLGFTPDDNGIYYLSYSPQGTLGIALYNIDTHSSQLLYAHEKYDINPGELISSSDGKQLIGVTIMGAQPERHYFSEHPDVGFHKGLDKTLAGYHISFLNFTKDQRKGLAMVSGPTVPPGLFLLDRDANSFKPLFSARPKLQGSPMTKAESLAIDTRDGAKIEAYLTRAAGVQGPAPLIVLIHGGPHGPRDEPDFNPEVKLLASRGYSVLQVNYRGSGGYGQQFQAAGYQHWGTRMIDDIIDATRYVTSQGLASADRVCAMGGSYGGYAAMMSIARYNDMFKCGVGISGVYDLNLMQKSDVPFIPGGKDYIAKVVGSDEKELAANSPTALASQIKVPVFLAHGGQDKRAPIKNADVFKKALDKAKVKYEWFYVDTAGHGFSLPSNREKLYTELFRFLDANLH